MSQIDDELAEETRQLRNEVQDLRAACKHYADQGRKVIEFLSVPTGGPEPISDEAIKRISGEAIGLAIDRHNLLVWNADGEHLTGDEIEEIKRDVFTAMTTAEPPPLIRDISARAK